VTRLGALLLSGWVLLLGGCAIAPPVAYDRAGLAQRQPPRLTLDQVPFFPQERLQCGPAALATALVYQGVETRPEALEPLLFIPAREGTLALELKAAPRRFGLIAPRLDGSLEALLDTLAEGYPVVVLQNLGLDWLPQWHYAVVVGYDLPEQTLLLNSGEHRHYRLAIGTFLHTWARAKQWAVVPSHPARPPTSVTPEALLDEATALEQLGHYREAVSLYTQLQGRLPDEPLVPFGLANSLHALGEPTALAHYLDLVEQHPQFVWGWNNLAFALAAEGCGTTARTAIACAVRLAPQQAAIIASQEELAREELAKASGEDAAHCHRLPRCGYEPERGPE